jgi:hypothetical protein
LADDIERLERRNFMGEDRLLRYSMQLAMLKQLLYAKKISTEEYQKIKNRLMKDYGIIADFSLANT